MNRKKPITRSRLLGMYRKMLVIRLCEESLVDPIRDGTVRTPCHLYSGQEAIAVGICEALNDDDYVFGNHRSHGHYLAKGGDIQSLVAEIFCKETGCSRGRGGSMHIIDTKKGMMGAVPIVAGTISLAVGSALASQIRKEKRVSVSFFGDGATGEGVFYESLNFASVKKLPILFVCENNFYSTHMAISECRAESRIYLSGIPFGVPSKRVDGNNVVQMYELATRFVDMCRKGKGPFLIECLTYRQRGHVGPDDNIQGTRTDIRPKREIEAFLKKDPIKKLERLLLKMGIAKDDLITIQEEIKGEVDKAHAVSREAGFPHKGDLTNHVFQG